MTHAIKVEEPSGRFATVGAGGFLPWPDSVCWKPCATWADVERWREVHGVKQVWVAADAPPELQPDGPAYQRREGWSVTIPGRARDRQGLGVWAGLDGWDLFGELWRWELAMGVLFVESPAITSDWLLREVHRRGRRVAETYAPPIAERQDGRAAEAAEGDLLWALPRERAALETRGWWCHHFDANAAYLAAANIRLPQGRPLHDRAQAADALAAGLPGYFLVDPSELAVPDWPVPVETNRRHRGRRSIWVTTPTLQLAAQHGATPTIGDAWVWHDHANALRPWYERLRDARTALADTGPAAAAVKACYRAGIGRLGSTRRGDPASPLYQPVWRHLVIAEARGRVWRRIRATGQVPLAVEVDGAWWITPHEDPAEAADWLNLPIGRDLGQWKHLGSGPASAAAESLAARTPIAALREVTG